MGLFSFLTAPKKMMEIEMALVGKHVYKNILTDIQRKEVHDLSDVRHKENISTRNIDDEDIRFRYLMYALAMMELGIPTSVTGFQWTYVRNPMMVKTYDEELWKISSDILSKRYGVNVTL